MGWGIPPTGRRLTSQLTSQLLIGRPDFLPVQGTNLQSAVELHHRQQFAYCLITKTYVGKQKMSLSLQKIVQNTA
jgi:hypothetical protein